jgi:hypothetical protein
MLSRIGNIPVMTSKRLGFHAERGVTQGDTMATICWVAIFDMILTWCDPENTSSDAAYADDLVTLTTDLATQQTKAVFPPSVLSLVWLSAFQKLKQSTFNIRMPLLFRHRP